METPDISPEFNKEKLIRQLVEDFIVVNAQAGALLHILFVLGEKVCIPKDKMENNFKCS